MIVSVVAPIANAFHGTIDDDLKIKFNFQRVAPTLFGLITFSSPKENAVPGTV